MQMYHSSNTSPPLFSHHHSSTDITTTTTTPLFEKSLTPSDVGKLNRLVIPKQHAEKHFPLNNNSSSSSSNDKGMLLSFEDDSGKCWRFRYSYWNSSQSYVLTKGWSRFVKDKELDPGDVVFFHRHLSDSQRLFIGCRRRAQNQIIASSNYSPYHPQLNHYYSSHYGTAATAVTETHSIPSPVTVGSSRTVRLFGVNLECQLDDDGDDDTSAVSTDVEPPCPDGYYGQNMYYYHLQTTPTMNIAFTGDTMRQMGDRR